VKLYPKAEKRKPFRHGYYEVSNLGIAYRVKPGRGVVVGRRLKCTLDKGGYLLVNTSYHNRHKTYLLHVLVARKFLGKCPPGKEVNHKDRNKENCRWDNLEYVTHLQNMRHALENGWEPGRRGEAHHAAKLSNHDIVEIRRLFRTGKYHKYSRTLARRFGVYVSTIYKIVTNRLWKEAA
jgi:HNH endonuclease